jgi:hypothetical protein
MAKTMKTEQATEGGPGLFNRLKSMFRQREETRAMGWRELVTRVADDDPPSDDEILAVLEETGATPERLAADVDRLRRRRVVKTSYDTAVAAGERWPKIRAESERLDQEMAEKIKALRDEYQPRFDQLAREEHVAYTTMTFSPFENELIRTAWPQERQDLSKLEQELHSALTAYQEAKGAIEGNNQWTEGRQRRLDETGAEVKRIREAIADLKRLMLTP